MATQPPLGPNDLPAVFECLQCCLSTDPFNRRRAEEALLAFETRPGFCSCLVEIILSKDVDHSARWLAVVHLKNSVPKYWRASLPGSLSEEEKAHLRAKLLPLLDQEDSQIAVQAAIVLAKVARFDYPKSWPSLFTDLTTRMAAAGAAGPPGTLTARRCYLGLHHTLKELASKRLAVDKRVFEMLAAQLLEPLWTTWCSDTSRVINNLPAALDMGHPMAALQEILVTCERWLLQLKALRRLLLFGFPSDAKTMELVVSVSQMTPHILNTLQTLLQGLNGHRGQSSQLLAMLERGILKLVKTLRQIVEIHPWSMMHSCALIPTLELCCLQIQAPALRSGAPADAIVLQCLLFLHTVIRCPSYRGSTTALSIAPGKGRENAAKLKELAEAAAPTLVAFWSHAGHPLVELVITRLFPLTDKELQTWEESGEEFHYELEHAAKGESVRGAAELLLVALLDSKRETLAPCIVDLLHRANEGSLMIESYYNGTHSRSVAPWAVRIKAAVYHAVAVGAYDLHDFVDFSSWIRTGGLLKEAEDAESSARPVRRAALKLLSAWTSKLHKGDRPPVYRTLMIGMQDPDPAIYLAAVAAMHALVDDWEFDESEFAEFVAPSFQLLAAQLARATEFESQLESFSLINLIIDRLGPGIVPHTAGLLALFPSVWSAGEGQSLLRIQVLLALQRVTHALGSESPISYPVLLPILAVATNPSQPDELNLLEDGLLLWLVALRHAPLPHPGLLGPIPNLLQAMETGTEHIAAGCRLLQSAVMLGGGDVLAAHGACIARVMGGYIGNVKERGTLWVISVMDTIIQVSSTDGPDLLAPALRALLADVLSGSSQNAAMVVAATVGLFARIILLNTAAFFRFFQECGDLVPDFKKSASSGAPAEPQGSPAEQLLLATLDIWLDRIDSITLPPARKLSALALCALLSTSVPALLTRLDAIIAAVTAVWYELETGNDDGRASLESLFAWTTPRDDDLPLAVNLEDAEGDALRRRALWDRSPLSHLSVREFAKLRLEAAAEAHGPAFNLALNGLDPTLAGQLKQMLDGGV